MIISARETPQMIQLRTIARSRRLSPSFLNFLAISFSRDFRDRRRYKPSEHGRGFIRRFLNLFMRKRICRNSRRKV